MNLNIKGQSIIHSLTISEMNTLTDEKEITPYTVPFTLFLAIWSKFKIEICNLSHAKTLITVLIRNAVFFFLREINVHYLSSCITENGS